MISPRAAVELAVWFLQGRDVAPPARDHLRELSDIADTNGLVDMVHGVRTPDFLNLPRLSERLRARLVDLGFLAAQNMLFQDGVDLSEQEAILSVLARAIGQSRLRHMPIITRSMLRANPDMLFVFGDNMLGTGFGGQAAEMRGEPNAVGIPTKRAPRMTPNAFFSDQDLPDALQAFEAPFRRLHAHLEAGGTIVMPEAGIGTGFARLAEKAPSIHEALERRLFDLDLRAMSSSVRELIERKTDQGPSLRRPA